MNLVSLSGFISEYLMSLLERTRVEKKGDKFGFDRVIYNLCEAKGLIPVRLPFFREPNVVAGKTKTEAEFGVDLSFISPNGKKLILFVLKDEALNNRNWTAHNFDPDIRMASTADLTLTEFVKVKSVKVILAYNKDEDRNGVMLFNSLKNSLGTTRGDGVKLVFERWNLTKLTEEVKENLMSPQLVPQHLASLLSYICSQVSDFDYGSAEWENQLIPNWKSFLDKTLSDPIDERKLRLIPTVLLILHHHQKDSSTVLPGWIDMIEWSMLALWKLHGNLKKDLKHLVARSWLFFYLPILEQYLLENESAFVSEHGLHTPWQVGSLSAIVDANTAFWNIGRLGIFTLGFEEFIDEDDSEQLGVAKNVLDRSVNWLVRSIRLSPSTIRPLVDVHHVQLYLIWLILLKAGRMGDICSWLSVLHQRLIYRRHNKQGLPFIESRNRLDLVAEHVATSKRPSEFTDSSSYLLLMILELTFSLEDEKRDELLETYYKKLIVGVDSDGDSDGEETKEIDLHGWIPPEDWGQRILRERVVDGVSISTSNFKGYSGLDKPLSEAVLDFVNQSKGKFPFEFPDGVPLTVLILACIKNKSPLPSAFWRDIIFKK